jgi:hypothetical protein
LVDESWVLWHLSAARGSLFAVSEATRRKRTFDAKRKNLPLNPPTAHPALDTNAHADISNKPHRDTIHDFRNFPHSLYLLYFLSFAHS